MLGEEFGVLAHAGLGQLSSERIRWIRWIQHLTPSLYIYYICVYIYIYLFIYL